MIERREFLMKSAAGLVAGYLSTASLARRPDVAANVAHYFRPLVARNDYSGFVIFERGRRTLVSRGFGFADDKRRIQHTPDTHYASASVGKMFTRAAILGLAKAGKLNRNDSLSRFFPTVAAWAPITVANLVDHTSGIARDFPPGTDLRRARTLDEIAAIIAAMPIEAKPGERTAYSNNGYRLLARVIEIAGGGPFDDLVRELVLEPRGMRNTFPNMPNSRFDRRTVGHWPGPGWGSKVKVAPIDMSNRRGEGSFAITPADMLRFLKTLPLEPSDLDESPGKDPDGRSKPRSLGHDGFGEGYANLTYAYPDEKAYLISLSNMETGAFMPMHDDLRRLLFGEAISAPTVPVPARPVPVGDWDRYVGDYDLRPGAPLRIRREGNVLTVDAGEGGHPLIPLGNDRFFMRLRYATMGFEGAAGSPATLLRWSEGGGEFPLKRIS